MKRFLVLTLGLSLLVGALSSATLLAQTEKTLLEFNFTNGEYPDSVTFDPSGNLWVVLNAGGIANTTNCTNFGCGTIVELTPSSGSWTPKVVYQFHGGNDGAFPSGNLYFDGQGNAYGTTYSGGASCGCGTVYELSPNNGGWKEIVLYHFEYNKDHKDGTTPLSGVIGDAAGNLYGTTQTGGLYSQGTVFELSKSPHGYWTEHILYNFQFNGTSGYLVYSPLVIDAQGNLYGTTDAGGTNGFCSGDTGCGIVFELSPGANGVWTEQSIYNFQDPTKGDADRSQGGLVMDAAGNMYGVTLYGGSLNCSGLGCGAVFELSPNSSGGWTESVIHSFGVTTLDGMQPIGKLTIDAAGNLYGATEYGGTYNWGSVYELSPSSSGTWTETQLYSFNRPGGLVPNSGLAFDSAGNLYGTTLTGGDNRGNCDVGLVGCGVVYQLKP